MSGAPMSSRLGKWWFDPAPPERLAALRIVLGGYTALDLLTRMPLLFGYTTFPAHDFAPVGVARILDAPLPPAVAHALIVAAFGLAVLFTIGWRFKIVAPIYAGTLLWVLTYRNSWGMVFHTENLQVLHAGVLAFAPCADAWSLDARRHARRGGFMTPADGRHGWAIRLVCAITVLTYVIAGISKLRIAGGDWVSGTQLRDQIAFDNLRRAVLGASPSPIAIPLLEHPAIFVGFAWMTIVIELGAPLAMLHRRVALGWALIAWGFHVGVLFLMSILFPYPCSGAAYASFFRLERPVGWVGRNLSRVAGRLRGR